MNKILRTYKELSRLQTFEERFEYLKIPGKVGSDTFGFDSIFRQKFLKSTEWRQVRDYVIDRDNGCDLGVEGYDILVDYGEKILIHHMNPISIEDIRDSTDFLLNPNYLICTTLDTHNAIHYSGKNPLMPDYIERRKHDMCPWRR